jgi:hypothetical protein
VLHYNTLEYVYNAGIHLRVWPASNTWRICSRVQEPLTRKYRTLATRFMQMKVYGKMLIKCAVILNPLKTEYYRNINKKFWKELIYLLSLHKLTVNNSRCHHIHTKSRPNPPIGSEVAPTSEV